MKAELKAELKEKLKELEAWLKELEAQEEQQKRERRKTFRRQWRFTVAPAKASFAAQELLLDGAVVYQLSGETLNAAEAQELGIVAEKGSMCYIHHPAVGIICSTGGGSRYIPRSSSGIVGASESEVVAESRRVARELSEFLKQSPEGGDVTVIVLSHKHFAWR